MKHAVIVTGGKQYRVAEGDDIFVEKLDVAAGETVKFEQVMAVVRLPFSAHLSSKAPASLPTSSRPARAPRFASTR